jgi:hypothetical protein
MPQEYAESLLRSGIIDAKAGQKDSARRYIERAIYTSNNDSHDVMAEAWFWMAQVTDDPVEKRNALENALSHDMYHARARRALAIIDGKLKPDEIVNPDNLPLALTGSRQADADRFMCPKCGGRMVFAPDGSSLVCESRERCGAGTGFYRVHGHRPRTWQAVAGAGISLSGVRCRIHPSARSDVNHLRVLWFAACCET